MHLLRVFMRMLRDRLGRRTLNLRFVLALYFRCENLLAAIHARNLINAVREAEIAALFILHYIRFLKRMMRPAIAGVASRMAHAN